MKQPTALNNYKISHAAASKIQINKLTDHIPKYSADNPPTDPLLYIIVVEGKFGPTIVLNMQAASLKFSRKAT